jgi:hypothetical protein
VTGTNTTNTNGQGYGATGNAAGQDGFIAIRY